MPAGGTPISDFTDFMKWTKPSFVTGPDQLVNLAQKNTYLISRMLKGRGMDEVIQGGSSIKDAIMVRDGSTFTHYLPNDTHNYSNPQVTEEVEIKWRYGVDHMAWTTQEIEHQVPQGLTKDARNVVYKRIKRIKEQRLATSITNGMDNAILRPAYGAAAKADMEDSGARSPYPIWAYITEDGLAPSGWTTVAGRTPSTEAYWRNQTEDYIVAAADDDTTGLFHAFDNMFLKLRYVPPKNFQEYFEKDDLNKQMILASRWGVNLYRSLLRGSNDRLMSPQDPAYSTPTYSGIPVEYIAGLDTIAYCAGGLTEAAAAAPGPRFIWPNCKYLKPVYHAGAYFRKHDPYTDAKQLNVYTQPVETWWNLFCISRMHQGIIVPVAA